MPIEEKVLTDREQMVQWEQERKAETRAFDQAVHYEMLGIGLAIFCQAMYDTLLLRQEGAPERFSRAEVLALVTAAVQGR